jgi:hypothetical protein
MGNSKHNIATAGLVAIQDLALAAPVTVAGCNRELYPVADTTCLQHACSGLRWNAELCWQSLLPPRLLCMPWLHTLPDCRVQWAACCTYWQQPSSHQHAQQCCANCHADTYCLPGRPVTVTVSLQQCTAQYVLRTSPQGWGHSRICVQPLADKHIQLLVQPAIRAAYIPTCPTACQAALTSNTAHLPLQWALSPLHPTRCKGPTLSLSP